jgi:plasmid segregation protein ParM
MGKVECAHFPSQAFYTLNEKGVDAIGGKRKTVCVPVEGVFYEVGPEVELAADRFRARQLHDGYTETAEYRALMAGALHYMKVEAIDLLVLGLPVAQFLAKRSILEKAMTGTFMTGKKSRVVVKRVLVVAQPQGALFDYATQHDLQSAVAQGKSLVVDAGSRTFDWLTTRGMKVVSNMSHSVTRGVSDILLAIARKISTEIGEEFDDLEAIDVALRSGKSLRIYQKEYDLKRLTR